MGTTGQYRHCVIGPHRGQRARVDLVDLFGAVAAAEHVRQDGRRFLTRSYHVSVMVSVGCARH